MRSVATPFISLAFLAVHCNALLPILFGAFLSHPFRFHPLLPFFFSGLLAYSLQFAPATPHPCASLRFIAILIGAILPLLFAPAAPHRTTSLLFIAVLPIS
jgi:hypothetical protein